MRGTFVAENAGATSIMPPMRVPNSTSVVADPGANGSKAATACIMAHQLASDGRLRSSSVGVPHRHLHQPGKADQKDGGHGEQLGNERERLFLDLRHRLEHADEQPDGERDEQHRAGERERHQDGVAREIDDQCV